MSNFEISYFELIFLAEATIPPVPIARGYFFEKLSDVYYHQLNEEQRVQLFEYITNNYKFSLENEDCRHFFARYNPKNQFKVHCFYNGKPDVIECYAFEGNYHTIRNRNINPEYIKKIERVFDNKIIQNETN